MKTVIIIFTGLPGTGKTTLSRLIAESLNITLISKDDIKEIMYDEIGWSDKEFSAKLGRATFEIMDYITIQNLKNNVSIILESNYSPKVASKKFKEWQTTYDCKIIQIVCQTKINTLVRRFCERQKNDRHPGHLDNSPPADCKINFNQRIENQEDQPLFVDGDSLIVDTTDFDKVNTNEITDWIRDKIKN